jgi:hypothetical protein
LPEAINYRRFVTAGMGAKSFHGTMLAQKESVFLVASSGPALGICMTSCSGRDFLFAPYV